jgi:SAM-dependent methyltransferase
LARNPAAPILNVNETAKTRWRTVPYTAGKGLDLGCGAQKLFETEFVLGIDNGYDADMGQPIAPNLSLDARDLSLFSSGQFDYVYSSFVLHYFPYEQVPQVLREWVRVCKTGACVVLYLPDENQYPKVGTPGAHPKQKWDVNYERVVEAMERTTWDFDLCEFQKCEQDDEYALFFSFRKLTKR